MELTQLHYFRAVAQTQNITAAAEMLHIAQPTLSKVIKRLEDDLGVQLFDRRAAKLTLNPLGEAYLVYVEMALDALARGRQCLENMQTGAGKGIRLVSTFTGVPNMLVEQFSLHHSDLTVSEVDVDPDEVISLLTNDHADFVLTLSSLDHPEVEEVACVVEPLLLHLPDSMEPPGEHGRLVASEHEHFAVFEGGKDQYAAFLRCCNMADFVPVVVYRSTRSQRVHELVNQLNACTLMPTHLVLHNWQRLPEKTRQHIQLVDVPRCNRLIRLYRRRRETVPEELKVFTDFSVQFFRNMDADITRLLIQCFPEKQDDFLQ